MSRKAQEVRAQLSSQPPASSRRSASTNQSTSIRLPPPPSATNDDGEEVDLEGQPEYNEPPAQAPASRFSFFSSNKNVPPSQPSMDEPTSFRNYGTTAQVDVNRLMDQQKTGPSETEFTVAKLLCLPGCACCSGGGGVFAFACYLSSLGLKDIAKEIVCCSASLLCCTKAVSATVCACGTCLVIGGVATALAAKRS